MLLNWYFCQICCIIASFTILLLCKIIFVCDVHKPIGAQQTQHKKIDSKVDHRQINDDLKLCHDTGYFPDHLHIFSARAHHDSDYAFVPCKSEKYTVQMNENNDCQVFLRLVGQVHMTTDTGLAFCSNVDCDEAERRSLSEVSSSNDGTKQNSTTTWHSLCMECGVRMEWNEFQRHFDEVHVKQNKRNILCPVHYSQLVDVKSLHLHSSCFREEASRDEAFCCRACKYKARRVGELVSHVLYMHKCYQCGCCGVSLPGGMVSLKMHRESCHSSFNLLLLMYKSMVDEFLIDFSDVAQSTVTDESGPVIVDLTVDDSDDDANSTTDNPSSGTGAGDSCATPPHLPTVDAEVATVTSSSRAESLDNNNETWPSGPVTVAPVEPSNRPRNAADTPVDRDSGVHYSGGRFRADQNVPLKKITIYRCTICWKQYETKKAACTHLGTVHLRRKILGDLIEAEDQYVARSTRQRSGRRRCNQIADGNFRYHFNIGRRPVDIPAVVVCDCSCPVMRQKYFPYIYLFENHFSQVEEYVY
ncbi:cyclic nucleotide-gated cation channel beta-3 [Trichinella spiralis]|uniref:cyclic nucleotide-gated cation channel beta-3 n=1 Tax=Trichinella spiralis TaxID=6334 RepID=UPI0001EFEC3C|nr:cyclic nucleotide-gated cation channel beta-3 [Trichinella spiralis]